MLLTTSLRLSCAVGPLGCLDGDFWSGLSDNPGTFSFDVKVRDGQERIMTNEEASYSLYGDGDDGKELEAADWPSFGYDTEFLSKYGLPCKKMNPSSGLVTAGTGASRGLLSHASRSTKLWKSGILVFSDSRVSVGVLARGRSSAAGALYLVRQEAAVLLVSSTKLALRREASGYNVAEVPSRGLPMGAVEATKSEH